MNRFRHRLRVFRDRDALHPVLLGGGADAGSTEAALAHRPLLSVWGAMHRADRSGGGLARYPAESALCAAEPHYWRWTPATMLRIAGETGYLCRVDLGTRWARLIGRRRMLSRVA